MSLICRQITNSFTFSFNNCNFFYKYFNFLS